MRLPRDFLDLLERSKLEGRSVKNLDHAVEWVKAEPQRFPRDFSRRGILKLGLVLPCAAALMWPRVTYAAGYTGTMFYPPVVTGPTYYVSTYVANPAVAATGLQNAINAVIATGGTLIFDAITYTIATQLSITGGTTPATAAQNYRLVCPSGTATIIAAAGIGLTAQLLATRRAKNFIYENLDFDGNRSGRSASADAHNCAFFEINSTQIGGGTAAIINCNSSRSAGPSSQSDGWLIRGADGAGVDPAKHSRNMLWFNCGAQDNARLGCAITNGHNILHLGFESLNHTLNDPQSGTDIEPNQPSTSGNAVDDVLYRGCRFGNNSGKGVHLSGGKGGSNGIRRVTVEGCEFYDSNTTPDPNSQGSAVHIICHDALVQSNYIHDFTRTNQNSLIMVQSGGADPPGILTSTGANILGNYFANITTGDPLIRLNVGTGHVVTGNRSSNIGASTFVSNGASGTVSDNIAGAQPFTPDAPWPTFANQVCIP